MSNAAIRDFIARNGLLQSSAARDALANIDDSQSAADVLVSQGLLTISDRAAIEQIIGRMESSTTLPSTAALSPDGSARAPQDSSSETTTKFGDYKVLSILGRGGMGIVYKAWHQKLKRMVALKMIRAGEFADAEQVRRFYAEAEAAAKLDHHGIVPVYETGEIAGRHFFAMAFVDGRPLSHEVKDTPLSATNAAALIKRVADALHFAHENGIVHRDIKPGNILLDTNGAPRVADFGLAKHLAGDNDMTREGHIIGTPSYMAPEQASGRSHIAGAAADIYAIGATLYYLLTGRPPIQAASQMETIRQVIETDPAPPRRLNPAISINLETICLKCLRKEPEKRYATAAALATDLQNWLDDKPIHARRTSLWERTRLWCKRRPTVAGSIAALTLAALMVAAVLLIQKQQNDAQRAASLVESVISAPPGGLPYTIDALLPLQEFAKPVLYETIQDPGMTAAQHLHANIALHRFGENRSQPIVSAIKSANAGECPNIVAALASDRGAVGRIKKHVGKAKLDDAALARFAIVALHLGNASLATEMCQLRQDPTQRTQFIDTLMRWRGDPADFPEILQSITSKSLRYAFLLGVAETEFIASRERRNWIALLRQLHATEESPAVHSALEFALSKHQTVGQEPIGESSQWKVNSIGITMLRTPAGTFQRNRIQKEAVQTVVISSPFWLSDREVTAAQYQAYRKEKDPDASAAGESDLDKPVDSVGWESAAGFCNWLSRKEGLEECYIQQDKKWVWKRRAKGYRLPTEAEWEYACRAKASTVYAHGDSDESRLFSMYAVRDVPESAIGATKMPNGFGFFDMHGNVSEWCYDLYQRNTISEPVLVDPSGPSELAPGTSVTRITRGGDHISSKYSLRAATRSAGHPRSGADRLGFRIARSE